MKKVFCIAAGVLAVLLLGCSAVLDAVTPCYIPPDTIKSADTEPTTFMPFTTLWDSQRIDRLIDLKYQRRQLEYFFRKKVSNIHQQAAMRMQADFIQPALAGLVGVGGLGIGWLGIKRPGDKTKEQLDHAGRMSPEDFEKTKV